MTAETEGNTTEQSERPAVLSPHLVLFLDFLGISNAATSWDDQRIARFIPILRMLARSQGSFSLDGQPLEDGSYKFIVNPEISTFSDNIVASYPIVENVVMTAPDQMTMYLEMATDLVALIAFHALNMSLLVRGGISFGRLHHDDGVVFGEAMVDAYQLESRVATYPRIVVSPRVYALKTEADVMTHKRTCLLQDTDGIWHLNYFSKILRDVRAQERADVFSRASAHIVSLASEFERKQKLNEFAKWSWFHVHYTQHAGPR